MFEPPKFRPGDRAAVDYLKENGYVVYEGAATPEQINTAIDLFWSLVERESFGVIKRDDPRTWQDSSERCIQFPADPRTGVCADYGIGQSEFMWYIRGLPSIDNIFQSVWETDDLLTSFDGCGVFRPAEFKEQQQSKSDPFRSNPWVTQGGWFHVDQNGYRKPDMVCVQGLLNLYPGGAKDGGLVVVPKSHHLFRKLFEVYQVGHPNDPDFVQLRLYPIDELWNKDTSVYKLCLNPGDFVLWDSRTIHCNHPANHLNRPLDDPVRLRRLAAYVCFTPASFAKDLSSLNKMRVAAFREAQTSTHWPHEFAASALPWISDTWKHPQLSERQKELLVGKEAAKGLTI
eukprot:TRINITY_DN1569_c0_g1_i2.p1 TRINITY_DN1569_c0_g1~~TRINITY_DN1569_c0_g1_i2.p1  ORF type:complete len:344 (-),score=52.83 TRINITY_DN1569_c0_g1_i2:77-1108(-)